MDAADVQVGSTITNGSSALRITERVERDPRWGTPSWAGINVSLEQFGGWSGTRTSVPDYLFAAPGVTPSPGAAFIASFDSDDDCCGLGIWKGEQIRGNGEGGWEHVECATPASSMPVCSRCFCVHNGEC